MAIRRYIGRRAVLGGFAATAAAGILAACGGTTNTDATKSIATAAVGATTVGSTTTAGSTTAAGSAPAAAYMGKKLNVALVLNGTLGDKSFFDSAQRGVERAKTELGATTKTIEMGTDPNKWQPGLADAAAGNYDVILCGTFDLVKPVTEVATGAKTKKFVFFDQSVPKVDNVYSVVFRQNEGSYLVGYMAGLLVQSTNADVQKGTGGGKKLAFLGGSNQPAINDFLVGYKQGAKDAGLDPAKDVLVSYVEGQNPFSDPAKGKELTLAMYGQGAGIAYNVAGSSGLGLLEAGAQQKRFTIGVDSDQYTLLKDSKPDQAAFIVTSMQKRVDNALLRAIRLAGEGTLKYGTTEAVGLKEGAVELADNENYKKLVPQDIRDKVAAKSKEIVAGTIKVDTAIM